MVEDILRTGYGKAFGKVILLGEHSVVYGHPALVVPFSGRVECFLSTNQANGVTGVNLQTPFYGGPLAAAPSILSGIATLVSKLQEDLLAPRHLTVKITSTIPVSSGLGSSAAVSVAITKAFYKLAGKLSAPKDLDCYAHIAEGIHHGSPSGVDAAAVIAAAPIYFKSRGDFEILNSNFTGKIIVADSGQPSNTKKAVNYLRQRLDDQAKQMKDLGNLTIAGHQAYIKNNPSALGVAMSKSHTILKSLGVSSEGLDDLVNAATSAGAYGAKMTGGGQGGCMVAVCDESSVDTVEAALLEAGAAGVWVLR